MSNKEVWSDLHYDLKHDGRGNLKKVINAEAVKTSIDNILRTSPFERVMLPTFASKLNQLVFSPLNEQTMQTAANEIKTSITQWDNRVVVNSVDFYAQPDQNMLRVEINYSIAGTINIFKHSVSVPASGVS